MHTHTHTHTHAHMDAHAHMLGGVVSVLCSICVGIKCWPAQWVLADSEAHQIPEGVYCMHRHIYVHIRTYAYCDVRTYIHNYVHMYVCTYTQCIHCAPAQLNTCLAHCLSLIPPGWEPDGHHCSTVLPVGLWPQAGHQSDGNQGCGRDGPSCEPTGDKRPQVQDWGTQDHDWAHAEHTDTDRHHQSWRYVRTYAHYMCFHVWCVVYFCAVIVH